MPSPFDQSFYQVRCEWGADGLARLAGAAPDVVVVVDVLRFSTTVTDAVARGETVVLDDAAHAARGNPSLSSGNPSLSSPFPSLSSRSPSLSSRFPSLSTRFPSLSRNGATVAAAASALRPAPLVLLGCLRNASAVARAVLAEQQQRGERTSVAVIAAGELPPDGSTSDPLRFAVEDQLGAGAIIDALADLGLDHSSPEAAASCEAFRGLRRAIRHLLTASGSGQQLLERDARAEILNAGELDAVDAVPVLRGGIFEAL